MLIAWLTRLLLPVAVFWQYFAYLLIESWKIFDAKHCVFVIVVPLVFFRFILHFLLYLIPVCGYGRGTVISKWYIIWHNFSQIFYLLLHSLKIFDCFIPCIHFKSLIFSMLKQCEFVIVQHLVIFLCPLEDFYWYAL